VNDGGGGATGKADLPTEAVAALFTVTLFESGAMKALPLTDDEEIPEVSAPNAPETARPKRPSQPRLFCSVALAECCLDFSFEGVRFCPTFFSFSFFVLQALSR
jgi:hypothetical protein